MEHERVVELLRRSADAVAPTPQERDRIRGRILAELSSSSPRVMVRPDPPPVRLPTRSTASGRLMVALAAALCLVFSLGAMSLLLSRDALPGDPLYAIKRSAESASFGLAFDDASKARKHLEFATARIDEIQDMVERSGTPVGSYLTALTDFDSDTAAGSRLLTVLGTNGDGSQLSYLRDWARSQSGRLALLRPSPPTRAATSADLLTSIIDRSNALLGRLKCYTIMTGATDDIGALPATGDCTTRPPTVQSSNSAPGMNPSSSTRPGQQGQPTGPGGGTPVTTPTLTFTTPAVPPPVTTPPTLPAPTNGGGKPTGITIPLPLPLGTLPPLLPGLPGIVIGG
jgi:Domain of unknown function (DUF5667)